MTIGEPASTPDNGLAARVTVAAVWMIGLRWTDRLIGLVSMAILARLLMPEDFGVVAYATLVIGLLDLLTAMSTDAELIRHPNADRAYFCAAWTMNILRGLAIAVAILVLVGPAVRFFEEPRLAVIMVALAAVPLISGFENVGMVEYRRELRFDREFKFLLGARLAGVGVSLAVAYVHRNHWSLVFGVLAQTVFRVASSYAYHPFRPSFTLARTGEIFRFSRWILLQNLAVGLNDRLPGFAIGHTADSKALAFFNIGKELADLATTELRAPMRRALYPGLARVVDAHENLTRALVETTGLMALVTLPIPLGIALVADDLVPLFLGPQWLPTIALLKPLCIGGSVAALGTNSQLAYLALNRPHLVAMQAWIRASLMLVLLVLFTPTHGVIGVAYAVASLTSATVIADYLISCHLLRMSRLRFLAAVWRPVCAAASMSAAVLLFRSAVAEGGASSAEHLSLLVGSAVLGASVYVATVLALWVLAGRGDGAERRLFALFASYVPRKSLRG